MSALPPIADIRQCKWNVRKVPKADIPLGGRRNLCEHQRKGVASGDLWGCRAPTGGSPSAVSKCRRGWPGRANRRGAKSKRPSRQASRQEPSSISGSYGTLQDSCWLQNCPRCAQSAPNYFIVIASPLRSAFAISPTCRPESSRMAPFWLVSTIARTPPPTASPAPAAA